MVNQQRLVDTFADLVRIDSPSHGEDKVAEMVATRLRALGLNPQQDALHNVTAFLDGTGEPLLLNAHMDSVQPCIGIEPLVDERRGIIHTDGTTILGADDPANFDFQTDLKKAKIEEARVKAGAKASTIPFYKYLGQPIPNYALRRDDGSTVKLYDLLGSKVTMLVVTITPENKGMMGHYNGVAMTLQTARSVYDNFALGDAGPGSLTVPNAYPDAQ